MVRLLIRLKALAQLAQGVKCRAAPLLLIVLAAYGANRMALRAGEVELKGHGISETGLRPSYPAEYVCSPLTSLYASWEDVDGSRREEPHSGVDGGKLGEPILSPGPGVVRAVWTADWGWGPEGALLIRHNATDLNVDEGVEHYYSAFYHLKREELSGYEVGQTIKRGQVLAHVGNPGESPIYLPEVHWETYEIVNDLATTWHENHRGKPYWTNHTAKLIDPLYMMSRHPGTLKGNQVLIEPFRRAKNYAGYRGFTYILPCRRAR